VRGGEWSATLGEWLLPWDRARTATDPEAMVTDFLNDSYAAAADLARWGRRALECAPGDPGRLRAV